MPARAVAQCQCPRCQQGEEHPDRRFHQQINLLVSRLDEAQRRWYAALASTRIGHGGDRLLAQITGLDEQTIRRGRAYALGQRASKALMSTLNLERHATCPIWNYTLRPRLNREVVL